MNKIVYLDMDGVIADLEGGLRRYWPDIDTSNKDRLFSEYLPSYVEKNGFATQPPFKNAQELVDMLLDVKNTFSDFTLAILTSSGHFYEPNSEVISQKKIFLENTFPELYHVPFCVTTSGADKSMFAHKFSFLIDDHENNIKRFYKRGGHGIRYKNVKVSDVEWDLIHFLADCDIELS